MTVDEAKESCKMPWRSIVFAYHGRQAEGIFFFVTFMFKALRA